MYFLCSFFTSFFGGVAAKVVFYGAFVLYSFCGSVGWCGWLVWLVGLFCLYNRTRTRITKYFNYTNILK